MQALIRSKSAGTTGGRGTAGAGPGRDLLYGSRGVPAAPTCRRPGESGPYEPCPSTPRVRIVDSVETTPEIGAIEERRRSRAWRTPEVEARREVRHSGRGGLDMEDLVSMCESRCRKACNLRSAAEDPEEACHSGSSGGQARRYRKRGSPESAARDAGGMDTDPSPVRLWESEGHSDSYRTCSPSESETPAPIARVHTAPEPALKHDAEGLERPARARTAPVPRHTGPEMDAVGDTPMGDESEAPVTTGCAGSGGKQAECHCEHVSFLMGKYPKMGMDAIVHRLDSRDNAKDGLEEDVAGILDDQSAAEKDMEELRAERDRYRENLELALEKQQRVVDSLLHLVEDMSGRLKRLEELQPLASGPELPAKPAVADLVERVKTLWSAMDKPMGGPGEAPYAPPRVDPENARTRPMPEPAPSFSPLTGPSIIRPPPKPRTLRRLPQPSPPPPTPQPPPPRPPHPPPTPRPHPALHPPGRGGHLPNRPPNPPPPRAAPPPPRPTPRRSPHPRPSRRPRPPPNGHPNPSVNPQPSPNPSPNPAPRGQHEPGPPRTSSTTSGPSRPRPEGSSAQRGAPPPSPTPPPPPSWRSAPRPKRDAPSPATSQSPQPRPTDRPRPSQNNARVHQQPPRPPTGPR